VNRLVQSKMINAILFGSSPKFYADVSFGLTLCTYIHYTLLRNSGDIFGNNSMYSFLSIIKRLKIFEQVQVKIC